MKITQFHIERMKETRDVKSLMAALAGAGNESIRVLAADALGDLHDVESVETLAQAALWDESEDVRSVAHDALVSILGNQSEAVLESYRANPPEEIDSPDAEDELDDSSEDEDEEDDSPWNEGDLDGLIMVLEGEPNLEMKLQAVQVLGQIDDTRATQALARATYVDEEPRLQDAARKALDNTFGEDTEEYIESIRQMDLGVSDEDEFEVESHGGAPFVEMEEDDNEMDAAVPVELYSRVPQPPETGSIFNRSANQSPVVEWDDPRKRILLPLVIGLLVLGIIIAAVFFLR